jgi:hypothetical protein
MPVHSSVSSLQSADVAPASVGRVGAIATSEAPNLFATCVLLGGPLIAATLAIAMLALR